MMNWTLRALILAASLALFASCSGEDPELEVEILEEIELTEDARLPEQDSAFVSVEVHADHLIFTYSGAPEIVLAPDHVVSGVQGPEGYLRRLTSVESLSDGRVRAETIPAELGELIGQGHFIVHYRPSASDYENVEDDVAGTRESLSGSIKFIPTAALTDRLKCGLGTSSSGLTLNPIFDIRTDSEIEIKLNWGSWWRGRRGILKRAKFLIAGEVEVGAQLEGTVNGTVACNYDVLSLLYAPGAVPEKKIPATRFAIGPIPVIWTHSFKPELKVRMSLSGEIADVNARMSGRIGFVAGVAYEEGSGWTQVWEPTRGGNASLTSSDRREDLRYSVKASLYGAIRYKGKLYDAAGPSFSIGPILRGEFNGEGCEYDYKVDLGGRVTADVVLEVPVLDSSIASVGLSHDFVNVTLTSGEGEFPWCDDMSEPDANVMDGGSDAGTGDAGTDGGGTSDVGTGDAGTDGGDAGGDAGTGDTGEVDPCNVASDCGACNAITSCGWCASTNTCVTSSDGRDMCPAVDWKDHVGGCYDCTTFDSCSTCVNDAYCGWCPGMGCINHFQTDLRATCDTYIRYTNRMMCM